MRAWILMAAVLAATPAAAAVDREAATARAAEFVPLIEPALTQPMTDLYQSAVHGVARDKWVYALALVSHRDNIDSVPPAQKAIYLDYQRRVDEARGAYRKRHPKRDISDKPMSDFVKPTPEEVSAIKLVYLIHDTDFWFQQAGSTEAVAQSRRCLDNIYEDLESTNLMEQLLSGLGSVTSSSTGETGDTTDILAELENAEKTDEDLDNEALCGGADSYANGRRLMKAIFKPTLTIEVTTSKND